MRAEILCVGSELLLGQIIDTNAAFIAQSLSRIGVDIHRKQTAGDNLERISDCIRGALARADVVVVTGGLGPTTDDLTREAIAVALDVELVHHQDLEDGLLAFFASRGITLTNTILRQAYLPDGAVALPNSNGTAPGVYATTAEGKTIFAVPGVPKEMRAMVELSVIPSILERMEGERQIIVSRVLRTTGIGESMLAEPIEDILTSSANPTAAPLLFGNTEVHLRLTAKAPDDETANALLDELEAKIRERVGEYIFGTDEQTIAAVVIHELKKQQLTLAVAESITGGLIASMLTDVPGASEVFKCGIVSYATEAKIDVLDVSPDIIDGAGVVSGDTASSMAEGVRRTAHADIAIATTGEAGPKAKSEAPVGTVYVGLADGGQSLSFKRELTGDRDAIRRRSAMHALDLLRRHLVQNKG